MCRCMSSPQKNDIPNKCVREYCNINGIEINYTLFKRSQKMLEKGGYRYCEKGRCCQDIREYEEKKCNI